MQIEKIITTIIACGTLAGIAWLTLSKYQDMVWAKNKTNQITAVNDCMLAAKMQASTETGTSQQFDAALYKLCMQDKGYPTSSK